jgi:hypothetical protein
MKGTICDFPVTRALVMATLLYEKLPHSSAGMSGNKTGEEL